MRDSMIFYASFYEAISCLSDDDQLALYKAIIGYGLHGTEPELSGVVLGMFRLMKPQIEANNRRFENGKRGGRKSDQGEQRLEETAEAAEAGRDRRSDMVRNQDRTKAEPKLNQTATERKPNNNQNQTKSEPNVNDNVNVNDNENVNVNEKKKTFTPPSVEDVMSYCNEQGFSVDPQLFVDFYTAKGWMIGKNKMKDWRAAVRNWQRSNKKSNINQAQNRFNNFDQRQYNYKDIEKQILNADQVEGDDEVPA